jgi:hypothetical protein
MKMRTGNPGPHLFFLPGSTLHELSNASPTPYNKINLLQAFLSRKFRVLSEGPAELCISAVPAYQGG